VREGESWDTARAAEEEVSKAMKRSTLALVFLIVVIDLMGFGLVIPLLPLYADRYSPSPLLFGLLMASYSLMQFLLTPVLGRLSDRFGRRPILLLSLAGGVAGYVLFALQDSLWLLLGSRLIGGGTGAAVATAQAVIADVTPPEERARGMGLIGAAFGLGFILGPAVSGFALRLGEAAPGFFAAGFSAAALALAGWKLPETWTESRRAARPAASRDWFSLRRLRLALGDRRIRVLLVMVFLYIFALSKFESTFALLLDRRLGLKIVDVTYMFVYLGILAAAVQGFLVGRLAKRFGERRLAVAGSALLVPCYLLFTWVGSSFAMVLLLLPLAFGMGLTGPALASLVSRRATADEQGGILGIYQGISSLGRIVGPFWGAYALERFGVAVPYLGGAALMAAVLVLSLRLRDPEGNP